MKKSKKEKLQKLGYIVTDTQNYLGLSDEEMALIDLKIQLIHKLKALLTGPPQVFSIFPNKYFLSKTSLTSGSVINISL